MNITTISQRTRERGVEPGLAGELIRARARARPVRPPVGDVGRRPVRIRSLGPFEIELDGSPLRPSGKAQRRPLARLRALIALGGADVPEQRLIRIAWPEPVEGEARKALEVALHRLRRRLGHDRAVTVSGCRVSLNPDLVWVDVFALERRLAAVTPLAQPVVPSAWQLEDAAPEILDLYRGPFLDGEPDASWLLAVRNRLNGRFQHFVTRLGDHWDAQHDWRRAEELYERALEIDPLAEALWQRHIACLAAQGRTTEAVDVYRRCRRVLAVALGVVPGENTEAIHRALHHAGGACGSARACAPAP